MDRGRPAKAREGRVQLQIVSRTAQLGYINDVETKIDARRNAVAVLSNWKQGKQFVHRFEGSTRLIEFFLLSLSKNEPPCESPA